MMIANKPAAPTADELRGKATVVERTAPSPKTDMTMVFVYGSLKRGHKLHGWLGDAMFAGEAVLRNAALIPYYSYPGLITGMADDCYVTGELWLVGNHDYALVTQMEEESGYVTANCAAVVTGGPAVVGSTVPAKVYTIPLPAGGYSWDIQPNARTYMAGINITQPTIKLI